MCTNYIQKQWAMLLWTHPVCLSLSKLSTNVSFETWVQSRMHWMRASARRYFVPYFHNRIGPNLDIIFCCCQSRIAHWRLWSLGSIWYGFTLDLAEARAGLREVLIIILSKSWGLQRSQQRRVLFGLQHMQPAGLVLSQSRWNSSAE